MSSNNTLNLKKGDLIIHNPAKPTKVGGEVFVYAETLEDGKLLVYPLTKEAVKTAQDKAGVLPPNEFVERDYTVISDFKDNIIKIENHLRGEKLNYYNAIVSVL